MRQVEIARGDPDDREAAVGDLEGLAEDRLVPAVALLPETFADDRHRRGANLVVAGREHPPQQWGDAERWEELSGYRTDPVGHRAIAHPPHVGPDPIVVHPGQPLEHPGALGERPHGRVRDGDMPEARRLEDTPRHQDPILLPDRQRAEQDVLHDPGHRQRRPDTQAERGRGGERQPPVSPQAAKCMPNIEWHSHGRILVLSHSALSVPTGSIPVARQAGTSVASAATAASTTAAATKVAGSVALTS